MCIISMLYIPEFTHKQHTYQVPDMCSIVKYHTHISHILHTYQVPDMYPIILILTSVRPFIHIFIDIFSLDLEYEGICIHIAELGLITISLLYISIPKAVHVELTKTQDRCS